MRRKGRRQRAGDRRARDMKGILLKVSEPMSERPAGALLGMGGRAIG